MVCYYGRDAATRLGLLIKGDMTTDGDAIAQDRTTHTGGCQPIRRNAQPYSVDLTFRVTIGTVNGEDVGENVRRFRCCAALATEWWGNEINIKGLRGGSAAPQPQFPLGHPHHSAGRRLAESPCTPDGVRWYGDDV